MSCRTVQMHPLTRRKTHDRIEKSHGVTDAELPRRRRVCDEISVLEAYVEGEGRPPISGSLCLLPLLDTMRQSTKAESE